MHFYEFNIGDYAKKTQHLTNEEDLCYRRLLDIYYDSEKPLETTGLATLSRRLRVSEESLTNVLDEFFPEGRNRHADERIAAYHTYIKRQKANGSKGGRPKHKPTANPVPSQPLTTKPLPTTHPKKKGPKFVPPVLEEVNQYISDKQYHVSSVAFIAHYESNGWMVGRNKMKSWKAALTTWQSRGNGNGSHQQAPKQSLAERATAARVRFEASEQQNDCKLVGEDDTPVRS